MIIEIRNWGKLFRGAKKERELIIWIRLEKELAVVCRPLLEKSGGMLVSFL